MPIGLALNAAKKSATSGSHNKEMDIQEYNNKLSARIAEIKQACGIQ